MPTEQPHVLAVRVGRPRGIPFRGKIVQSAITKVPVEGPVMLRQTNLDGDEQGDLALHGGVDKAVYLYAAQDYEWWRSELGREIPDGLFGENLTVSGDWLTSVRIGDRFQIGDAVVAANEPREPCFKLGVQMSDQSFLKRFREAGRTGAYFTVITEGKLQAGDSIVALEAGDPANITIAELHDLYVNGRADRDRLAAALAGPDMTDGWRDWIDRRLAELAEE